MKNWILMLAASAMTAFAQESPSLWAHVDFVEITPGKRAEYRAAMKDKVRPKREEAIQAGREYALVSYRRRFPHNSGEPSEVRMLFTRKLNDALMGTPSGDGAPPGLFHTKQGELWRLNHSENLDALLKSPILRVLLLRPKDGHPSSDTVAIYKTMRAQAEGANGLAVLFRIAAGTPSDDFTVAVLWGYANPEQVERVYERSTQQPPETQLRLAKLREVRDVVRTEIWSRIDAESAGPIQ